VHSRRPNLGYTPGPVPTGNTDSLEVVKKLIAKADRSDARMTKNGMKDGQRNRHNRLAHRVPLAAKRRRRSHESAGRGWRERQDSGSRRQHAADGRGRNGDVVSAKTAARWLATRKKPLRR
jgi:hypothetical protein